MTLAVTTGYDGAEFAQLAAEAGVLFNTIRPVNVAALALAPCVRFIQQLGVGYDAIDRTVVTAAGVMVVHNPGVNAASRKKAPGWFAPESLQTPSTGHTDVACPDRRGGARLGVANSGWGLTYVHADRQAGEVAPSA